MSKIDELIAKHYPNGVAFKKLGEVCKIKTGDMVSKQLISSNPGEYPVINSGKEPLGFINEWNTENDPIGITSRGVGVGSITWCEGKFYRGNLNYSCTIRDNEPLLVRFLFHLLNSMQPQIQALCTHDGIPALNKANLDRLRIPIPPLPVQEKIVGILDSFTELEAELETELETELEARQQQYTCYLYNLLSFSEDEEYTTLGEICKLSRGRVISKDYLRENVGDYPVYSSQTANNGILGKINTYDYDGTFITWTTDGAHAGSVFYHADKKFSLTNVCGLISNNSPEKIDLKFLYYVLKATAKSYVYSGMGNPKLMSNVMSTIKVPLPPLSEQQKIVDILDKFDLLVNDISDGIPAEIIARRQQYEYYRHQLLTFKEVA